MREVFPPFFELFFSSSRTKNFSQKLTFLLSHSLFQKNKNKNKMSSHPDPNLTYAHDLVARMAADVVAVTALTGTAWHHFTLR